MARRPAYGYAQNKMDGVHLRRKIVTTTLLFLYHFRYDLCVSLVIQVYTIVVY